MSKRYYVISYDISDDKKREMMAKLLERYGVRVQKSVFECYVDEKLIIEIKRKASSIIDMETDSVRFYLLCKRCVETIEFIDEIDGIRFSDETCKRCVETIEFIGKTPSLEEGEIDII